ncbi:PREDICTED: butyrophilin subfamily 1 member A1-like [Chrysochloris asiatica]|uniref:Butyrophilin subfamily 1 member A1-like n=1 Tax=Chrysochloris asiatica TaxID=185453 RepID=A0A9B0U8A5_CHRAS|nr:PREDICTED: butyrophilin subfamily 1 member A1-like [Chrysochloris asiatica]
MSVYTEKFLVIGPMNPIVAVLGGDIKLSCFLSPVMNAENMELRWFRSNFSEAVFIYENQREQKEKQMLQYKGRTSLVRDFLTQGEASVRIDKVRASDNGLYTCFFRSGDFHEDATLEVKVAGVGSDPQVYIDGPEEDGIRMVCMASGWFPKPLVKWKDPSREKFLAFSESYAQDAEGLFSVAASLVVRDSSVRNVTCSILNPILGQEKVKAIFIPEPFFPQVSPWMPTFVVSLTILMLLSLGAGYFLKKEHSTKVQEWKNQEDLQQKKGEDKKDLELARKEADELQRELKWRKEQFETWSVTLDPQSAHSNLALSQENMSMSRKDNCEDLTDDSCSVLGTKGITSGRCYWEVEVRDGDTNEWAVGVCREDVNRDGWFKESPEKGFWVVGNFSDGFCACNNPDTLLTLRQIPCQVGVFLDYDGGDVSFYMTDGSHIFSFSQVSFSGTLFPYFMIMSGTPCLTICYMGLNLHYSPLAPGLCPHKDLSLSGSPYDGSVWSFRLPKVKDFEAKIL